MGIDESMTKHIVFVIDQGANIISALCSYKRINCSAHMLNTVLRHMFDEACLSEHQPNLQSPLQKVKAVVTFMKQSGLVRRLPHGVCQEASTQ